MRKLYQFLIFIVSNWFKNILDHSLNVNLLKVFHSLLLLIIFIVILFVCFGSNIFLSLPSTISKLLEVSNFFFLNTEKRFKFKISTKLN